ncbi:unnamed protein product [Cyprideis torosa]|uniref:Uncharacterized protein n=1 Tax=Cyprideis torosa TaxID=163714 RepID=A0A7R8WBD3_9CRUS|nr:unnamed protein product [Cyprideis torosa]CAG0886172.1 unnamed protein product [Cyprideis torosa]
MASTNDNLPKLMLTRPSVDLGGGELPKLTSQRPRLPLLQVTCPSLGSDNTDSNPFAEFEAQNQVKRIGDKGNLRRLSEEDVPEALAPPVDSEIDLVLTEFPPEPPGFGCHPDELLFGLRQRYGVDIQTPKEFHEDAPDHFKQHWTEFKEFQTSEPASSQPSTTIQFNLKMSLGVGDVGNPQDVACSRNGSILVTDSLKKCVHIFSENGVHKSMFAGDLQCPTGVSSHEGSGWVVVADYGAPAVLIFDQAGVCRSTITHPNMKGPRGIALLRQTNRVLVSDSVSQRVLLFSLDRGHLITQIRSHGEHGELLCPQSVAVDPRGRILVSDFRGGCVKVFNADHSFAMGLNIPGGFPTGVNVDPKGNTVVADWWNNRYLIFDSEGNGLGCSEFAKNPPIGIQGICHGRDPNIIVAAVGGQRAIQVVEFPRLKLPSTMDRMPPCNLQPSTTSPSEEQISNFQLCDVSCRSEHIYSNQDTWTESSPKNVLDLESMFSELSPPTTESPPESHHLASGISLVFSPPSNGCTELTQPIETVVGNNELSNLMSHEPPSTEPPGSYYVSLPIVLEESMTPPMSSSEEIKLPPRRSRRRRKKVSPLDPAIEFDPGRHSLSDEELKPRPMIYKTRKLLIPNEMKDEDYWERRKKNNDAAKRSRDIKRMKEARIKMRLAHLEKENVALRQEVSELKRVNAALSEDMANLIEHSSPFRCWTGEGDLDVDAVCSLLPGDAVPDAAGGEGGGGLEGEIRSSKWCLPMQQESIESSAAQWKKETEQLKCNLRPRRQEGWLLVSFFLESFRRCFCPCTQEQQVIVLSSISQN